MCGQVPSRPADATDLVLHSIDEANDARRGPDITARNTPTAPSPRHRSRVGQDRNEIRDRHAERCSRDLGSPSAHELIGLGRADRLARAHQNPSDTTCSCSCSSSRGADHSPGPTSEASEASELHREKTAIAVGYVAASDVAIAANLAGFFVVGEVIVQRGFSSNKRVSIPIRHVLAQLVGPAWAAAGLPVAVHVGEK